MTAAGLLLNAATLTCSYHFRFYYDVWPLVQSMPELLHHLPKVVSKLQTAVLSAPAASLPSFLSLISVLAR